MEGSPASGREGPAPGCSACTGRYAYGSLWPARQAHRPGAGLAPPHGVQPGVVRGAGADTCGIAHAPPRRLRGHRCTMQGPTRDAPHLCRDRRRQTLRMAGVQVRPQARANLLPTTPRGLETTAQPPQRTVFLRVLQPWTGLPLAPSQCTPHKGAPPVRSLGSLATAGRGGIALCQIEVGHGLAHLPSQRLLGELGIDLAPRCGLGVPGWLSTADHGLGMGCGLSSHRAASGSE
jgi:hypothetical protein